MLQALSLSLPLPLPPSHTHLLQGEEALIKTAQVSTRCKPLRLLLLCFFLLLAVLLFVLRVDILDVCKLTAYRMCPYVYTCTNACKCIQTHMHTDTHAYRHTCIQTHNDTRTKHDAQTKPNTQTKQNKTHTHLQYFSCNSRSLSSFSKSFSMNLLTTRACASPESLSLRNESFNITNTHA